jgi:hypothetical protein
MSTIAEQLSAHFDPAQIQWRPITTSKDGKNGLAAAYVDARAVADRLNEVLGIDGWQDKYELMHDGNMICHLSIWSEEKKMWITRCDVGDEGQAPDKGTKAKSACSNALKRAAVKFGVGRYLYDIDHTWVPVDQYKRITKEGYAQLDRLLPRPVNKPPAKPPEPAKPQHDPLATPAQVDEVVRMADNAHVPIETILQKFNLPKLQGVLTQSLCQTIKNKLQLTLDQQAEVARQEKEMFDHAKRVAGGEQSA